MNTEPVTIAVDETHRVSGLLLSPKGARACYVLAHGAGAGMTHPFMAAITDRLRHAASPRFAISSPIWSRAASARMRRSSPDDGTRGGRGGLPSRSQSSPYRRRQIFRRPHDLAGAGPVPPPRRARLDIPRLSPARAPDIRPKERAAHLFEVEIPMLFLQGTRDALADIALMRKLAASLGRRATLVPIAEGDHSFHVPARTGRNNEDVRAEMLELSPAGSRP